MATDPAAPGEAGGVAFDAEALFGGSARLGLLLGALGLPWEHVAPFVAAFPGELAAYQELSVSSGRADMGIMTRGAGVAFTHRVAHFMEAHGIAEPALRRFLVTARYFEHGNVFFKAEVGPSGVEEMSWYLRRRPEAEVARAWLQSGGVDHAGLGLFDALASALDKRTVHFLATSERPGEDPVLKVYFSQPDNLAAWQRVEAAVLLAGVSRDEWAPVGGRVFELARHTAFVSVGFRGGRALPGAKVDIHDVKPDVVRAIAGGAAAPLDVLLGVTGRDHFDYAGFRLIPGQPLAVRGYVTRE